jgi:hypothetical protein
VTLRVLVSYHYHRNTDLSQLVSDFGDDVDLFADSGAYSAATTGAVIDLDAYAAWLHQWSDLFTVRANLDVIGDHVATAVNYERLRAAGCDPLPVFHVGEPWSVLEQMCADHRYVALGGLALHLTNRGMRRQIMAWLVKAFRIGRDHGTVFHGFGVTSARLARSLPFYSLDSSSYTYGQRFGLVYLWDARTLRMRSLFFRDRQEVRPLVRLLLLHGLDPVRLLDPGFMRAGSSARHDDGTLLTAASGRAFRFMEQSLIERHAVLSPPLPRHGEIGTKIYLTLAGASAADVAPLRLLASEGTLTP